LEKVRNILFKDHDPYKDLNLLPKNDFGWASENPCYMEFMSIVKPKRIVEIGTWMGGSSRAFVKVAEQLGLLDDEFEIICIDTFLGSFEHWNRTGYDMPFKNGRPTIYEQFLSNTVHAGYEKYVTPFPVDSQNGYLTFKHFNLSADMVYIDAGHDYVSVKNDIVNWRKILRLGGLMIGDDWFHPPIKDAVRDTLTNYFDRGAKFVWIK